MRQLSFNTIQLTILAVLGAPGNRKSSKPMIIYFVLLANKTWKKESVEKRLEQFQKMRIVDCTEEVEISEKEAKSVVYCRLTSRGEKIMRHINAPALLEPILKNISWGAIGE